MDTEQVLSDQANTENSNAGDETSSVLFEIGERRYTAESAVKKIENADSHIKRLEEENQVFREQLQKAKAYEDVLNALKNDQQSVETPVSPDVDLDERVRKIVEETEHAKIKENNLRAADSMMQKQFGKEAKNVAERRASELGLNMQTMRDIAAKSPNAFIQLFAQSAQQQVATTSGSTVNSSAIGKGNEPEKGTYAYYSALKKQNPKLYNSPQVQAQMMRDAELLGRDKFFS